MTTSTERWFRAALAVLVALAPLACQAAPSPPPATVVVPSAAPVAPAASSSAAAEPPAPCAPPRAWPSVVLPSADASTTPGTQPDAALLAGATAVVRASCRTLESRNKVRLASLYSSGPGPFGKEGKDAIWKSKDLGCFPVPKGAWAIEIGVFRNAKDRGEVAPWTLVYLSPDAKRVTGEAARGEIAISLGEGETGAEMAGAYDFDGDGIGEVTVREHSSWSIDGEMHSALHGYRLRGGKIASWDPVPGKTMWGWSDVDRDGRPDLVIDAEHGTEAIAHSLPGGGFSTDDAITRAVRHASCARPAQPAPPPGYPAAPPAASLDAQQQQVVQKAEQAHATFCAPWVDAPCPGGR